MTDQQTSGWTLERLTPLGVVVNSAQTAADLHSLPLNELKQLIDQHRVVILRGFAPLAGSALPKFCEGLGELLEWEFGTINDLQQRPNAQNYLYTDRAVPFHWDGAFAGRVPHYIFFQCEAAPPPERGGETLFCDALGLLQRAPPERFAVWERTTITYTTEKVVHYGGTFSSPMVEQHPISGEKVLRYAEPVVDLNPVQVEIAGVTPEARIEFLQDLHQRLHDPGVCYQHRWFTHDIVIADNFALLHGRNAFEGTAERHIRRVNIL